MNSKRTTLMTGLAVSLLIHGIALWFALDTDPLVIKTSGADAESRLTVSMLPSAPSVPSAPPARSQSKQAHDAPAKPRKKPPAVDAARKTPRKPAPVTDKQAADASRTAPSAPLPEADRGKPLPTGDLFAQVEAARKRRAEAEEALGMASPADPQPMPEMPKSDNSVAMANIEFSMKHSRKGDREDVGGVFQVQRVGYRDAEFLFRGWSQNRNRNSTRLITVEQGSNADIQTALVKKVIDIIREEKKEDFVWESKRLGKPITLSARPQDHKELEQFLLREFFPDYVPLS